MMARPGPASRCEHQGVVLPGFRLTVPSNWAPVAHAETQKRERHLSQDVPRNEDRSLRQNDAPGQRQNVAANEIPGGGAEAAGASTSRARGR